MAEPYIVTPPVDALPTRDAYDAACRALEAKSEELRELRGKIAALVACERHAVYGRGFAARHILPMVLRGEHDPRDTARRWLLEYDEFGEAL